mgnify:FL=1
MTRVRAKYGSRLTVKDYEALTGLSSLGEAASYLSGNSNFAAYFDGAAGRRDISRAVFEGAVRSAFYGTARKLCSSESDAGDHIYRYIALGLENDYVLDYIINLSLGTPEKMILKRVPELRTGTKLDLAKLFKIKDPAELGRYLSKTKYAKLVPALPKNAGEKFDISLIETVLSKIKYKLAFAEIERSYGAETAKVLEESIKTRIELTDFLTVYRAKKYYGMSEMSLRTALVGYRCVMNSATWERIITAKTADQALTEFSASGYAPRIERFGTHDLELFKEKAAAAKDIRHMHFSTDPIIVLASYLRLFQDECDNLIKIAEGITYKLPQDEIMADLILL